MKVSIKSRAGILAMLLMSGLPLGIAVGQQTTPAGLEARLDEYFEERMIEWFVPGSVCVVVQNGEIVFSKGYGVTHLESSRPVDPETTLFYLASVGKLFTATAVLQLADQGLVDLDEDVNVYLTEFEIEEAFDEPVTLAHLLTHTGGFDERAIGYLAPTVDAVRPLGEYLRDRMPPRVMPPGTVTSYSNHGFGLAGHIVAEVSGMPFEQYVQENILTALGMDHSASSLLPPEELEDNIAQGYWSTGEPAALMFRNCPPAGGVYSTGVDMAKFMIAQLGGQDDASRAAVTESMRSQIYRQQFTHDPRMPGYGFAAYERTLNGKRGWEIAGSGPGFASSVFLLPEENLGIFVTLDRQEPDFALDVAPLVVDHLYPLPNEIGALSPPADFHARAKRFEGSYRPTRYGARSLEKLVTLLKFVTVSATPDGTLSIPIPDRGRTRMTEWVEVEPLLFRAVDSERHIAFREDESGGIKYLFTNEILNGPFALERIPWYESQALILWLIGFQMFTFVTVCLAATIIALVQRFRKADTRNRGWRRRLNVLALSFCLLNIAFYVGIALSMRDQNALLTGVSWKMAGVLTLPLVSLIPLGAYGYALARVWRNERLPFAARVWHGTVCVAALSFYGVLATFNLLGYHY